MRGVNEIINVSRVVPHCRLVRGEPPIPVDYEFELVDSPLQGLHEGELTSTRLLHRQTFLPFSEAAYQKCFTSALVPSEHNVDLVCLLRGWTLLGLWPDLKPARVIGDADSVPKEAAVV